MHTDPELLSLLALSEDTGDDESILHSQSCPTCAEELSQLQLVVTLGRSVRDEGPLVVPSGDVWSRISKELALDPSLHPVTDNAVTRELAAQAHLTPVDASWSQASGTAELHSDAQGRRVLQVALHADLPSSGVRQAWLIHRDDPTMRQTLGILDGVDGLWTVDHSVDLEQYAILDISQQEIGETEHSGHSLVRGELTLIS